MLAGSRVSARKVIWWPSPVMEEIISPATTDDAVTTNDTRSPATISGIAAGSNTRRNNAIRLAPSVTAYSTNRASTVAKAAMVCSATGKKP